MTTPVGIDTTVNGRRVTLELEPNELLLDVLRERLGLRGVKRSCEVSVCGACTVLLDGEPYSSCSTLALEADGRAVTTVEGIGGGDGGHGGHGLSDVQQALVEEGAIQCGFCTPGFALAAHALLDRHPQADRQQILHYLAGNLCRCSGYAAIVRAVERVRDERAGLR